VAMAVFLEQPVREREREGDTNLVPMESRPTVDPFYFFGTFRTDGVCNLK
jgi:hypothetical protein